MPHVIAQNLDELRDRFGSVLVRRQLFQSRLQIKQGVLLDGVSSVQISQPSWNAASHLNAGQTSTSHFQGNISVFQDNRPIQRIPKRIPNRYKTMHPDRCRYMEFPNKTSKKPQQNRAKASDSAPRLHPKCFRIKHLPRQRPITGTKTGTKIVTDA